MTTLERIASTAALIVICMMLIATATPVRAADVRDIEMVNAFWNDTIHPTEDISTHGKDHWQSPAESWKRKTGDCDDYAIAKYYTLLSLGVPAKALQLANVVHTMNGKPGLHLVLFYTDERGTWVLDNIAQDIMLQQQRWDIKHVMAVYDNKGTHWLGIRPTKIHTPEMWKAMQANTAKHIADAKAAYNTRPYKTATLTYVPY